MHQLARRTIAASVFLAVLSVPATCAKFTLQSKFLKLTLDDTRGLSSVFDKRTNTTWKQYGRTIPKGFQIISDPTFQQPLGKVWPEGDRYSRVQNPDGSYAFVVNFDGATGAIKPNTVPRCPFWKAKYTFTIRYKAENASNVSCVPYMMCLNGNWIGDISWSNAWSYGSTPKTDSEWQTWTTTVEPGKVPAGATEVYPQIRFNPKGKATGKIYIKEIRVEVAEDTDLSDIRVAGVVQKGDKLTFKVNTGERTAAGKPAFDAELSIPAGSPTDVVYKIKGDPSWQMGRLSYPAMFHSGRKDLKWAIPMGEGLLLPGMDVENPNNKRYKGGEVYWYDAINMAFFAGVNTKTSDYCMALIDTPVTSYLNYSIGSLRNGVMCYMPQISWGSNKGIWGSDRQIRFRFGSKGGYVGAAKEYRKIAKSRGYLVTFKEKAKTNPNVLRAVGGPFLMLHETWDTTQQILRDFQDNNIKRATIRLQTRDNGDQMVKITPEMCKAVKDAGYLLERYDNYRDRRAPKNADKPDVLSKRANGEKIPAWPGFYLLCQKAVMEEARKGIPKQIETYGFDTYFVDLLGTTSLTEGICYDPNHPCDAPTAMQVRKDLANYISKDLNMVFWYEGNEEWLVPYTIGGEGALSFNKGYDDNCKIPLWSLVFHGCNETTWHWEDGNQGKDRPKKDLYNILYGTHQYFTLYRKGTNPYSTSRDQVLQSIKTVGSVLDKVYLDEMLSHEFVTPDGKVQRTVFSSGWEVIVNLSDRDVKCGRDIVKAMDFVVRRVQR